MSVTIEDGRGSGIIAGVTSLNQLLTKATIETDEESAAKSGNTYNINTGILSLTDANESKVLYLKNIYSTRNIIITQIGYSLGTSTGGAGLANAYVYKNPTTGTIIDNALPVFINENKNFGSANTMESMVYNGANGYTSDGVATYLSRFPAGGTYTIATGDLIIPAGQSISVGIQPPTGNTSMELMIFLAIFIEP